MSFFKPPKKNPFQLGRTPLPSTAWKMPPPPIDLSVRKPDPKTLNPPVPVFTRRNTLTGFLTFPVNGGTLDFFTPNATCSVLWIEFQLASSATIQLFKNGISTALSKPDVLNAGAFRRYAGLLLTGDDKLSLSCSTGNTIAFEVAWAHGYHDDLLLVDDMVSQGPTSAKATYNNTFTVPAASPPAAFDIWQLQGSATKLIKIWMIELSTVAITSATSLLINFTRRSTTDTGMGFLSSNNFDLADAAPTAVASIGPSSALGTSNGLLRTTRFIIPTSAGPEESPQYRLDFGPSGINRKPIVLRGVNDFFTIGGGSSLGQTITFSGSVDWTEE